MIMIWMVIKFLLRNLIVERKTQMNALLAKVRVIGLEIVQEVTTEWEEEEIEMIEIEMIEKEIEIII